MDDDKETPTTTTATDDVPKLEEETEKEKEQSKQDITSPTLSETKSEDSSDNSAVMVDHKDAGEQARALQIVRIGGEDNGMFVCTRKKFIFCGFVE